MSTSEKIVEALIILIDNTEILKALREKASDFDDYHLFVEELKNWFLNELETYSEAMATSDDPVIDSMFPKFLMFSTILASAIQNLGEEEWNKLAQHLLSKKQLKEQNHEGIFSTVNQ